MAKYIFVTGGVVSSLGKGITAASLGRLLKSRGIKVTIPDRADQRANRQRKGSAGGRPTAFDPTIYRGRNVVERCFSKLKNWRGSATRTDKLARNYYAATCYAATLIWLNTGFTNTP